MRGPACLLLCLAGCAPPAPGGESTAIACILAGEAATCRVERAAPGLLVIRHPDGGFRRFRMGEGGVTAADGAERLAARREGETLELAVGGERYAVPLAVVETQGE